MRTMILSLLLVAAPAFAQDKPDAKAADAKSDTAAKPKKGKAKLMDINTATTDELKTLPGVTDEIAGKIVAGRPYTGKDQLVKQNIVDKDEYAKIRPLIHAYQPKAIGGQGAANAHTMPDPAAKPAPSPAPAPAPKK
jgi:competence protein ComEA